MQPIKFTLTIDQIHELIQDNKYAVNPSQKFLSRCIDGRYNGEQDRALAYPGADFGELALVYATAHQYGLTVHPKKVLAALLEIVGGPHHFAYHTDTHADTHTPAGGCGHMKTIRADAKAFSLDEDDMKVLEEQIRDVIKRKAPNVVLEGDHKEAAVLFIEGNHSVYPQYTMSTIHGSIHTQVFIYHKTLVDERHKAFARRLVESQAVILPPGFDYLYLYDALSDVAEQHVLEIAGRLAQGLPIYRVIFAKDNTFTVFDEGHVPAHT